MKQVARKSTTSVPQKLSAGNHQPNGLLRDLLATKTSATVTSNASSSSSETELTNGIHTSCEQVLRNNSVPSNPSRAIATPHTIRQQTVQRSVCTVTSASNLPVSTVNSPLPTASQTSANVENNKNLKNVPVPVKHASAVTTTESSSLAASVATSVNSVDDVIIVNSDMAVASKPDVDSVKRCVSPAEEKKCEVKKAKLDDAAGQSVKVEGSSRLTRKEIDSWLLNFSDQYVKSKHESNMALMSKKIKELEENQKKLHNRAQKMHRQIIDLSAQHTKIVHSTATSTSATPVTGQPKISSNSPLKLPIALPTLAPALPSSIRMLQTTVAPCRLPAASANLAAVQRYVSVNSLQAQVANVVVTGSCAPTSAAVDSCRSVIDLTDDDDTNAAVAKPPAPIQQVILVAPPHPASLPPPLTLPSTAIVKPTMRPVPPPPLHIAPNQQARLQSCSVLRHPAPLPPVPLSPVVPPTAKLIPPKPTLKLSRVTNGIVLSWNMATSVRHAEASTYHLYAYQEGTDPPSTNLWKRIGTVNALPLPMACTLTQFQLGNIYHFAVRAVDVHGRYSAFSEPGSIHLDP